MRSLLTLLAALVIVSLDALHASDATQPRPNIILLFADDLGYADLGCYGATDIPTPNLDALAAAGVCFTDFYVAASVCTPSRAALLTGCYPRRVGLTRVLHPHEKKGLAQNETTVAGMLRDAGYSTACFGKWHLGDHESFLPHHHGFEETLVIPYSHDMYRGASWGSLVFTGTWPERVPLYREGTKAAELRGPEEFATLTRRFTDSACAFIERRAPGPFFVYLPFTLPHLELHAPAPWRGKSKRGPYGDAVAELDDAVGRILATLKRCGLEENTLVVFSSDNGPARIYQQPSFAGGSPRPFSGGKNTGFEGGFRVPCLMRWPRQIPPATKSSALCSTMDLLPTFAAITGAALPVARIDGQNILPLMRHPDYAKSPHVGFLYYKDETPFAVRGGDSKLWLPNTPFNQTPHARLYRLSEDSSEQRDLSAQQPEEVRRLTELALTLAIPEAQVRKAGTIPKSVPKD